MDGRTNAIVAAGVVELVSWLSGCGYAVRDCSDGTPEGVRAGRMPFPMVEVTSSPGRMIWETDQLYAELGRRGAEFDGEDVRCQCTYDPVRHEAVILLMGLLSRDLDLRTEIPEDFS